MTTTTEPESVAPAVRPGSVGGASFATTMLGSARRTILQFFRTPQVLVMSTVQGAMFLIMFRYVFGGAINSGGALSYVDFLVPGFLATTVLWTGMGAASGVAEDAASGVHDRLRSLPIPRAAVVVGRSLADTILVTWGLLITGVLGFLVGFRVHASVADVAIAFLLIIVSGFAFAWVFILIGLVSGNAQAAQGLSMLVIPFSFVSSANVPIKSMPGWMQPFAANQPVTVVINAVRCLMQGGAGRVGIDHSTTYWVAACLIWCAVIAVVFGASSVARFSRTR